jgi:nucleotide-binding universal stress UspA family protein
MKVLVLVDHDRSTDKGFKEALKTFDPEKDELYLLNVYSTWDYTNFERNLGHLMLFDYSDYAQSLGVGTFKTTEKLRVLMSVLQIQAAETQIGSGDPKGAVLDYIKQKEIDVVYTGAHTFSYCSEDSPGLFQAFSALKR